MRTFTILTLSLIFFVGCHFSEPKKIVINKPEEEIIKELKNLHGFEKVKFSSFAMGGGGDSTEYTLKIYLINGKDLPIGDSLLRELGKKGMKTLFESIDNEEEFSNYKVIFVKESQKGNFKMTEENPFVYGIEDFK